MVNLLYGLCALGLGHVTRSLPLIRYYLKNGDKIYILSQDNVLSFLKTEFPKEKNLFLIKEECKYPPLERGKNLFLYTKNIIFDGLSMPGIVEQEHQQVEKLVKKHNLKFVISDGSYGAYSNKVPSFLLTHQIHFQFQGITAPFGNIGSLYNRTVFKKFKKVFILDYPNSELAGKLSRAGKNKNLVPVGILSMYEKKNLKQDIDYLVIISGFLFEHKQEFYDKIFGVLKNRKGKKMFIMGDYIQDYYKKEGDIEIYSSFKGLDKNEIFNRAKVVISRTGYTTLMDLVEMEKDAILIPTPNQSEQRYLGKYHKKKGYFNIIENQRKISEETLRHNLKNTKNMHSTKLKKTKDTVKKIVALIKKEVG